MTPNLKIELEKVIEIMNREPEKADRGLRMAEVVQDIWHSIITFALAFVVGYVIWTFVSTYLCMKKTGVEGFLCLIDGQVNWHAAKLILYLGL